MKRYVTQRPPPVTHLTIVKRLMESQLPGTELQQNVTDGEVLRGRHGGVALSECVRVRIQSCSGLVRHVCSVRSADAHAAY